MNESVKFRVHTLLINDDGKTLSDNVGDTINSYKYFYHRDLTWEQFNRLNLDIKRCWQELQHDYPELRGLKYPERIKRGGTKRIEFAKHKNQGQIEPQFKCLQGFEMNEAVMERKRLAERPLFQKLKEWIF